MNKIPLVTMGCPTFYPGFRAKGVSSFNRVSGWSNVSPVWPCCTYNGQDIVLVTVGIQPHTAVPLSVNEIRQVVHTFISTDLISSETSALRRVAVTAVKRHSSPWLRPITEL